MDITEDEAALLFNTILLKLGELHAEDVIAGIDESRRLGIEETVVPQRNLRSEINRAELKSLGTVRRRPPTNLEMLRIAIQRIRQRLIILPAIAQRLERDLGSAQICWRVDENFILSERAQNLEASLAEFRPHGVTSIETAYRNLHALIADAFPDLEPVTTNG